MALDLHPACALHRRHLAAGAACAALAAGLIGSPLEHGSQLEKSGQLGGAPVQGAPLSLSLPRSGQAFTSAFTPAAHPAPSDLPGWRYPQKPLGRPLAIGEAAA